ncbi:MAG: Gfo/Idh/MocA family oxidoreductase, partial [Oceanipulchritudo sp.]
MIQEPPNPLSMAAIGCGSRAQTYLRLAGQQPGRYRVVAGADPLTHRVSRTAELSGNPDFRHFGSADEILAEPRMADIMVIGTQDATHREFSIRAMEKGYDLLLEKPIATSLEDVLAIEAAARRYGRRVLICHVLRYTPLYGKIKAIVESGQLGELVSLSATEGVEA